MKDQKVIDELCKQEGIIYSPDGDGFENEGDFSSFRCYTCLKPFPTWEESHPKGTPSAQMNGDW